MKSTQFQVLLCLGTLAVLCLSLPSQFQVRNTRLCGRELSNLLDTLCGGSFYEVKRGGLLPSPRIPSRLWKDILEAGSRPGDVEGLLDGQNAMEFFPRLEGRPKRGVAEECCYKSCSYGDLMQYCSGK